MGFQLSAGVDVKETDLSTTIPGSATSLGAMVGVFGKGPAYDRTIITTENELVKVFGKPTDYNASSFFTAANFLQYGNNLTIVRVLATDARNASSGAVHPQPISNVDDYENLKSSIPEGFYAKSVGIDGNNISVSYANAAEFIGWAHEDLFDSAPNAATTQEVNLVVLYDSVPVETYTVSLLSNGKDSEGNNIFIDDVLMNRSGYVYSIVGDGDIITYSDPDADSTDTLADFTLAGGTDGLGRPTTASWMLGWDEFSDPEQVDVNLLLAGAAASEDVGLASDVQRYVVQSVAEARKDCVAFVSPPKTIVVGRTASDAVSDLQNWRTGQGNYTSNNFNVNSSYGMLDGNFKYMYDKYNDKYRWVPLAGDIAGLCVVTDNQRDPWWSPGGLTRGRIKGVVKLAFTANKGHRDQLYKSPYGINPIVSMPGKGTVLWGDKTTLTKPSAFDRINVRRLFIVLEKSIATASQYTLFEFNDEYTRNLFKGMVEPFMNDVKGRRGVYDFKVVCDESNNTGEVIDRNEFVADIYIKPTRSINYISLNFVATKTGVEFSELFGQV